MEPSSIASQAGEQPKFVSTNEKPITVTREQLVGINQHLVLIFTCEMMMLYRLTAIFLLLSSLDTSSKPKAQMPECLFRGIDLFPCLSTSAATAANTTESCCSAINQALSVGLNCLCSLLLAPSTGLFLGPINPLSAPLELALPGCSLSSPSPTACQGPLQLTSPSVATNETGLPPPTATAPAPKPTVGDQMEPNTTHTQPQLVREGPNDKDKVTVLSTGGVKNGNPNGGKRDIVDWSYKTFICVIMAFCAWFTY